MSRHLSRVLNRQSLLQMGGAATFARGEEYFVGSQVLNLELRGGIVRAVVSGTREYLSRLWEQSKSPIRRNKVDTALSPRLGNGNTRHWVVFQVFREQLATS